MSPFLAQFPAGKPLSREQAEQARDECMASLTERLLERANIIQRRLNEENETLKKREAAYQRSQGAHSEKDDEEFNEFYEQTMFRIHILDARLHRVRLSTDTHTMSMLQRTHSCARAAREDGDEEVQGTRHETTSRQQAGSNLSADLNRAGVCQSLIYTELKTQASSVFACSSSLSSSDCFSQSINGKDFSRSSAAISASTAQEDSTGAACQSNIVSSSSTSTS